MRKNYFTLARSEKWISSSQTDLHIWGENKKILIGVGWKMRLTCISAWMDSLLIPPFPSLSLSLTHTHTHTSHAPHTSLLFGPLVAAYKPHGATVQGHSIHTSLLHTHKHTHQYFESTHVDKQAFSSTDKDQTNLSHFNNFNQPCWNTKTMKLTIFNHSVLEIQVSIVLVVINLTNKLLLYVWSNLKLCFVNSWFQTLEYSTESKNASNHITTNKAKWLFSSYFWPLFKRASFSRQLRQSVDNISSSIKP